MPFQQKIKKLPDCPGVYIFRDKKGKIIYIGKALSLKKRVGSYFVGFHDRKTQALVSQINKVEIRKTANALEALILEANLIKKHQPKYNIKEKDDKSFSYFLITDEEFPRVLIKRETDIKKIDNWKEKIGRSIFGPYTSKKLMESALKILRKIFPFHSSSRKTEKGCLYYQLGQCPGPYAGKISRRDYLKNIRGIRLVLEGRKIKLFNELKKEMEKAAQNEDFEKAALWRDKLFALQHIQDIALVSGFSSRFLPYQGRIEAYDISHISGRFPVGAMVVFEKGIPQKQSYRRFQIKKISKINDVAMMEEVLERRLSHKEWPFPDLFLLDGGVAHFKTGSRLLKKQGIKIPLVAIAKGKSRRQIIVYSDQKTKKLFSSLLKEKEFLGQIMDEAHRFAIAYHRKKRKI